MLEGIRSITSRSQAQQVAQFLDDNSIPSGELVLKQHRERMWVNVEAAERVRS